MATRLTYRKINDPLKRRTVDLTECKDSIGPAPGEIVEAKLIGSVFPYGTPKDSNNFFETKGISARCFIETNIHTNH